MGRPITWRAVAVVVAAVSLLGLLVSFGVGLIANQQSAGSPTYACEQPDGSVVRQSTPCDVNGVD